MSDGESEPIPGPSAAMPGGRSLLSVSLPYALTVLFTVIIGAVAAHHEMWRDELQAWLLVRDSTGPLALLHNIRYEGHPGLWHLLLWPLAQLSQDPALMQLLNVFIAGASAFLVFRFSPFSWPVKLLLVFGYYFAYEWGVIARNYAVSVFLIFGLCSLWGKRWRKFHIIGVVLFLLCHTNIHSILIVLVLLSVLVVEFAVPHAGQNREAKQYTGRFAAGMAIAVIGLVTGVIQTMPPPDTGYAPQWNLTVNRSDVRLTAETVINAYLPVPPDQLQFWNVNRFVAPQEGPAQGWQIPPEHFIAWAVVLLGLGCLFFLKRPWLLVPYLLCTFAELAFFYVKYLGKWRHHGFLFLIFVMVLWMSFHYQPWTARPAWLERLSGLWDRHRMKALTPLLAIQVWGAVVAIQAEWKGVFSYAEATAYWLNEQFPDRNAVFFVGNESPHASSVACCMQLDRMYYSDRDGFGSYIVWDNRRTLVTGMDLGMRIASAIVGQGKDAVLVMTDRVPTDDGGGIRFLNRFDGPAVTDERYYLYYWPKADAASWRGR